MTKRICTKCNIEKPITDFNKHIRMKGGFRSICKSCTNEYNKERYSTSETHRQNLKRYRDNMSEEQKYTHLLKKRCRKRGVSMEVILEEERISKLASEQNKKYCYECKKILDKGCFCKLKISSDGLNTVCKECRKVASKKYHYDNVDRVMVRKKKYYNVNKKEIRRKIDEYTKNRRKTDPAFKMAINIRNRIRAYVKHKGISKRISKTTTEIVGCSPQELREHIEKKFLNGMTWNNHGTNGWHIDHIIPLASVNTYEEIIKLNHYTNLQPLWAEENLKKGKKIL